MKLKLIVVLLSVASYYLYKNYAPHNYLKLNTPVQKHASYVFNSVFSQKDFESIQNLAKNTTFEMTLRADNTKESDYGSEDISNKKVKACTHKYRHLNNDKTKCIVPARIDVAKHLLMTGGWNSKKESYEKLISRSKFFQHFWADFNPESPQIIPEILELFKREDYLQEAKKICQGQEYLDPMQASILVALPGQEIAMHVDTPWFYGADRTEFPLWLLAVMRQSGLYDDIAINQVQGVAYLHEWNDPKQGGGFYFYDQGPAGNMTLVNAVPNRGLIVDGTLLVHGTESFKPGQQPVPIDKDTDYYIKFNQETQKWDVFEQDTGKLFNSYSQNDVRISLVWRQRCFDSKDDFLNFKEKNQSAKQLKIEDVIDNLLNKLMEKNIISQKPTEEIDIITVLLDNYIKMPYPESNFPYNYCLLGKLAPFAKPLIDMLCD